MKKIKSILNTTPLMLIEGKFVSNMTHSNLVSDIDDLDKNIVKEYSFKLVLEYQGKVIACLDIPISKQTCGDEADKKGLRMFTSDYAKAIEIALWDEKLDLFLFFDKAQHESNACLGTFQISRGFLEGFHDTDELFRKHKDLVQKF